MEKRSLSRGSNPPLASSAHVFTHAEILPANTQLLLDLATHTALLLSAEGAEATLRFRAFSLTPSAAQVFCSLLQAYPRYCSHQSLFHALYPSAGSNEEQPWSQEKDLAIPLIRRALKSLLPTLRGCGLRAIALRGQGYVLASIAPVRETPSR